MRNFDPKSRQQNERKITRQHKGFPGGAFNDIPSSTIPDGGIKYSENYVLYGDRAEMRGGTKRWSNTTLPSLRTGLSVSKSGATVTKTVGDDFEPEDIGNYIVYDDGKHELIKGFTSSTVVTVENSTAHADSTAAWVRGPYEIWHHKGKNKLILHIDNRLFSSSITTITWAEIGRIGPYYMSFNQSKSFEELDNYCYIFNDNLLFKANLDTNLYYPLNTRVPTTRITDVAKTASLDWGYRVVYAGARLTGDDPNRDRTTADVINELQSGPTQPGTNDYRDFGEVWLSRPIGEYSTTYGILTGIAPSGAMLTIILTELITDAEFKISVGGTEKNIGPMDYSGVVTWAEIAKITQDGLRDAFPNNEITCEWNGTALVLTSDEEGGVITVASAGDGGTDIATISGLLGGTVTTPSPNYTTPLTVTLTMPTDEDTARKQQHWTHYPVYRTLDIGKNGIDGQTGKGNNKELYIWDSDIPVAKVFTASLTSNTITATTDIFNKNDVGDTIKFQDGTTVVITAYTSATVVSGTNADITSQPAALGGGAHATINGNVITASQTGTTVTRTAGASFSADEVGKVIYWQNGLRSTVKTYTDGNTVTVYETQEITSTAAFFDPVSRVVQLYTRDEYNGTDTTVKQIKPRAAGFSLANRFWSALPKGVECGAIVNGMLLVAERGKRKVYYSQLADGQEYYGGYFNANKQVTILKDKIKHIVPFENSIAILCTHSTHAIPLNTLTQSVAESVGEVTFIITGQYAVDLQIGCFDWGSVAKVDKQRVIVQTSEPSIKYLGIGATGKLEYSDNLAYNRIQKKLNLSNYESASSYDRINGYIIWTRNTERFIPLPDPDGDGEAETRWDLLLDADIDYNLVLFDPTKYDFII